MSTVRLTMTQALVRYLCNQFTIIDGERVPLFPGVFAIFGHGNVTCLAEALEEVRDRMPTWRGQNEQSMALAAIGYTRAKLRRQIMVCASSIGPGALNMVTAAGVAHSNRLPLLILAGDAFTSRRPDPVLQQVEHFNNPNINVNDAFKAVTRFWDRIVHPEQILSSLPQAVATMLDPGDCGPAFIGLPQDTQEVAFDYPEVFFEETVHQPVRIRPDRERIAEAARLLMKAKRPLIIAGGGVRYSQAGKVLGDLAAKHGIPLSETIAGKGGVHHEHPAHIGPMGISGALSANALAAEADVILAVGTRLADFTTGSWTCFSQDAKFISINAARHDAIKHRSLAVVADAREAVSELAEAVKDWKADSGWTQKGKAEFAKWNDVIDEMQKPTNGPNPSYAQVIGVVNTLADERDMVITAAGGLPGETSKNWRVKSPNTVDIEYGFSCMGYEIAGGWGAAMAEPERNTFVLVGDGTYLMMNSDIYSSVLTGHKLIIVVCDNAGYLIIDRLQSAAGGVNFNNMIRDCRVVEPFTVDFAQHAASMGALSRKVESLADLREAVEWAKTTDRTTVITVRLDDKIWTPGDVFWDIGLPEVSNRKSVRDAASTQVANRKKQRVGV
ncbi:MAG: 3D-(3,5/4)-trihydroxycyclohexane-1,2-dione acylhydrolase (decyclizing) [Rhizobiaceae bacterium]|nr:3D-(3,5/4)-trihydroxycyclohexane-1,2-dione acylhydrolase (decyclizing) [Rhizobiaceae bacterium]